jgi:hypothetical protein
MDEEEEAEGWHGAPLAPGAVATGLGKTREGARRGKRCFFLLFFTEGKVRCIYLVGRIWWKESGPLILKSNGR